MWVAHSFGDDNYERCLRIPLPGHRVLPLCSRCSAFYPTLAVGLLAFTLGGWPGPPTWLLWILPLPSLVEAVTEWLELRPAHNGLRFLLAVPLGITVAALLTRYFDNALDSTFWAIVLIYGGIAGVVLLIRLRREIAIRSV